VARGRARLGDIDRGVQDVIAGSESDDESPPTFKINLGQKDKVCLDPLPMGPLKIAVVWVQLGCLDVNSPTFDPNVHPAIEMRMQVLWYGEKSTSRQFPGGSHHLDVRTVPIDVANSDVVSQSLPGDVLDVGPLFR
jgi:hypothetical protein